jgi:7-cyano-7-deazaguanine synthase in queuosine biosynthesis
MHANKKIGLSISGGADSAILAYLLMKCRQEPLHFFIYISKAKNNKTLTNAIAVIDKCRELTNKQDVHIHVRYAPIQQRDQFFQFLLESVDNKIVDIVYTGTTSTPPANIIELFNDKQSLEFLDRRDPNKKKKNWSDANKLYHPLINMDKKNIASLYKSLNLMDTLYPVTVSCEDPTLITEHCGKCWWCQERIWAFGKT